MIRHVYGAQVTVEILVVALDLYGLLDRYQVRSSAAQQLRLWVGVKWEPEAISAGT